MDGFTLYINLTGNFWTIRSLSEIQPVATDGNIWRSLREKTSSINRLWGGPKRKREKCHISVFGQI